MVLVISILELKNLNSHSLYISFLVVYVHPHTMTIFRNYQEAEVTINSLGMPCVLSVMIMFNLK